MSLNNFATRTITGVIFVIVLISSMLIHKYLLAGLLFIVCFLGTLEFHKLITQNLQISISKWVTLVLNSISYLIILTTALFPNYYYLLYFMVLLLPTLLIIELYRKTKTSLTNVAIGLFSFIYITTPLALLNYFYYLPISNTSNGFFLMVFFILIWANDTGAYMVGSLIGKHRFFERISPKKSWEGFWGGLILSMVAGYFFNIYFEFMPINSWLCLNLIIVLSSSFGDLAESMIKRNIGVKDSGNILPGHGGILDRFDAVIFSSPFVFVYLQLFNLL